MRKIALLLAVSAVLLAVAVAPVWAGCNQLQMYYDGSSRLAFQYSGGKLPTWGHYDIQMTQPDRIVGYPGNMQIFLEAYEVGKFPVNIRYVSGWPFLTIYLIGDFPNIPCGTEFQIYWEAYRDGKIVREYWALGPGEPTPDNLNIIKNVQVISKPAGGYVFRTTCWCPY